LAADTEGDGKAKRQIRQFGVSFSVGLKQRFATCRDYFAIPRIRPKLGVEECFLATVLRLGQTLSGTSYLGECEISKSEVPSIGFSWRGFASIRNARFIGFNGFAI
jgi:hypothetical protein